jgi:hypothetical protein
MILSDDQGAAVGAIGDCYSGHFLDHVRFDKDRDWRDQWLKRDLVEADWGWVVTYHKAQGSGWSMSSSSTTAGGATRSSAAGGSTPPLPEPPTG